MTRKDYRAIAKVFQAFREDRATNHPNGGRSQFADNILQRAMADMLAADNPRFDRERFDTACEV